MEYMSLLDIILQHHADNLFVIRKESNRDQMIP